MITNQNLILASSSPRRLKLLDKIGIVPNKVIPADIDETPKKAEKPYEYVKRVSLEKAMFVAKENAGSYIISADTAVIKGRTILGKPKDRSQAESFLNILSGGKHNVLTGFTVISPTGQAVTKVIKTVITLKRLSREEINWYLESGEWEGKSGGYAIQGKFEMFVKQINGSISNVVGLPLFNVYNTLTGMGYKFNYKADLNNE